MFNIVQKIKSLKIYFYKEIKKNLSFILIVLFFSSLQYPTNYFTGKIVYKYQFEDAKGNDITDAMAKVIGKEQHYFINEKNYKAYDEKGNLLQLYNSDSNNYYQITKDKAVQKIDASIATSQIFTVKKLKIKETIAGYSCNAIEVITDDATTTYFYAPTIKINADVYKKHNYGEWNKILKATNGSLPLKFSMINHKQGFITWTCTAVSIKKQKLTEEDFDIPSDL